MLATGQLSRREREHAVVADPAQYSRLAVHGLSEPLDVSYTWFPLRLRRIYELAPDTVVAAVQRGQEAMRAMWPREITKDDLLAFFRSVGESGYSQSTLETLQYAACLWLHSHRSPAADSDDDDAADDDAAADGDGLSRDARPRYRITGALLRDASGLGAVAWALAIGRDVPIQARNERNIGALALPPAESQSWLGGFAKWVPSGSRTPPSCEYSRIAAHYREMFVRGEIPEDSAESGIAMSRPMLRALRRILHMSQAPKIDMCICQLAAGMWVTWIKGRVPASQASNVLYQCCVCLQCMPLDPSLGALLGQPGAGAPLEDGRASTPMYSVERVIWAECACKQKWKCAHVGSLLWILTLWDIARREDHRDRARAGRIAFDAWWTGLSHEAVEAHELQMRCVPVHLLDLTGMREGEMPEPGGEHGPKRRPKWDYDPLHAFGSESEAYPTFIDFSTEALIKLYGAANLDLLTQPGGMGQVRMCSHQYAYTHGAGWLMMDTQKREAAFPVGSRDGDVMRAYDELRVALARDASRAALLAPPNGRRGQRARRASV